MKAFRSGTIGVVLVLMSVSVEIDLPVASARSTTQPAQKSTQQATRPRRYQPPPKPKNRRVVGNRGTLGIRTACASLQRQQSPIALMPENRSATAEKSAPEVWAQTTVARPTLWFYSPYTHRDGLTAELILRDAAGNQGKLDRIELPATPGIIGVQLPETLQLAAVDQPYQWFFKVKCLESRDNDKNDLLSGWIQRVELPAASQQAIASVPEAQRVDRYAAQGLWLDALTAAAELRRASPENPIWNELLAEIGLDAIAQVAIAP